MDAVARYYDPAGSFAGTLFLDVEPNDPFNVDAADLYAVITLSMKLDARHGRVCCTTRMWRAGIHRQRRNLNPDLPVTDRSTARAGAPKRCS